MKKSGLQVGDSATVNLETDGYANFYHLFFEFFDLSRSEKWHIYLQKRSLILTHSTYA